MGVGKTFRPHPILPLLRPHSTSPRHRTPSRRLTTSRPNHSHNRKTKAFLCLLLLPRPSRRSNNTNRTLPLHQSFRGVSVRSKRPLLPATLSPFSFSVPVFTVSGIPSPLSLHTFVWGIYFLIPLSLYKSHTQLHKLVLSSQQHHHLSPAHTINSFTLYSLDLVNYFRKKF